MGPVPSASNGQDDGGVRPVELLHRLGDLALKNGNPDEAMEHFDKALSQSGLNRLIGVGAGGLLGLEDTRHAQNDLAKVSHSTGQIARDLHDWMRGGLVNSNSTQGLAEVEALRIQYNYAEQFYDVARTIYSRIGNQLGFANATLRLGTMQYVQGEYPKAEALYLEARGIYDGVEDQLGVADSTRGLAEVQYSKNEYSTAEVSYIEARDIYDRIGNGLGVANVTLGLGEIQRLRGQYLDAEASYMKAREIYSRIGNRWGFANATQRMEMVQLVQDEYFTAGALYPEARAIDDGVGDPLGVADSARGLEEIQCHPGEDRTSEPWCSGGFEAHERIWGKPDVADVLQGGASFQQEIIGNRGPPSLMSIPKLRDLVEPKGGRRVSTIWFIA
ncbi:hypothetical protein FRC04_001417 [Tulasnella sp. 424]|nr:hypothetical protein FRC04_001417 [Tulasnella sp. 424]KAG8972693.1 hypothetical protein FRC05_009614 [Tulasnella sp. 425]